MSDDFNDPKKVYPPSPPLSTSSGSQRKIDAANPLVRTIAPLPVVLTPASKPGWYTSEFILTALIVVGLFTALILGRITVNDIANLWPLILGTGAYAVSRGLAKKG